MIKNFLTFDLENWYDSDFIRKEDKHGRDFVLEGLNKIIKLLRKYNVRATFFVTGDVLEKYPKEIKRLSLAGHEIASHSYEHIMLNKMSDSDIRNNIIKSKKIIKKVTGKYPKGFRAPSWSINKRLFWVYDFLAKEGFRYSASLFPVYMGAYGSFGFPTHIFKPSGKNNIIELPVMPWEIFGIRLPFSGGIYLRIWHKSIISFFIKNLNKKNKRVVVYMHPWELCENIPRVKMPVIGRVISYWGLKNAASKLEFMLKNFEFDSIENILKF